MSNIEPWTLIRKWYVHHKYTELSEFSERMVLSHVKHKTKFMMYFVIGGLFLTWFLSWAMVPWVDFSCSKPEGIVFQSANTSNGLSIRPNTNPTLTPKQAACDLEVFYSHPIMSFWNYKKTYPIKDLKGFSVVEIVGDESDSYRLYLNTKNGRKALFTANFESTAFNRLDKVADFLNDSDAEFVKINYKSPFYFYLFFIPWALFSFYVFILAWMTKANPHLSSNVWVFDQVTQLCKIESHGLITGRTKGAVISFKNIESISVEVSDEEGSSNLLGIYMNLYNRDEYTLGNIPITANKDSTLSSYKLVTKIEDFIDS